MKVDLSLIEIKVQCEYEVKLKINDETPQTWYFDNEMDAQKAFDIINNFFEMLEDHLSEDNTQ